MVGQVNGHVNGYTNGHGSNGSLRKTYLVTGANRGIGKGLVESYLQRPNARVIACVRNPAASEESLQALPKADNASLIVAKLDCSAEMDAAAAADGLQAQHNVTQIDVIVANAGMAAHYGPTSTLPLDSLQEHMMVNCYSVLLLFQAMHRMLQKTCELGRQPKFVYIGAPLSTITQMEECARAPLGAYGITKLAANYLVRKWHFENKWLTTFVVDPGHVQTDMGVQGARLMGRASAPTTLEASVNGICARIDEATKEKTSGQFVLWEDGSRVPW